MSGDRGRGYEGEEGGREKGWELGMGEGGRKEVQGKKWKGDK